MAAREPARGSLASLRAVAGGVVEPAATRLELAATELEEERVHLTQLALWAVLTLVLPGIGSVFAGLLQALLLWHGPREMAMGGLALLFLGGGVPSACAWRHQAWPGPSGWLGTAG